MSKLKPFVICICIFLLFPICNNWIAFISNSFFADNNITPPETSDTEEIVEDTEKVEFEEIPTTEEEKRLTRETIKKKTDNSNNIKKETESDQENKEKPNKPKKSDLVKVSDTPLKFSLISCKKLAVLKRDDSYKNLTSITIPSKVQQYDEVFNVKFFDWNAFYDCSNLEEIEIPSTIPDFYRSDFSHCKKLSRIKVPSDHPKYTSVDGILYNKDKTELLMVPIGRKGEVKILASVKKIGNNAFDKCYGVTNVVIPSGVKEIGKFAFYDCTGLKNIEIPASVESLDYDAFRNCTKLEKVTYNNISNIKNLGDGVFCSCRSLTNIQIPPKITHIPSALYLGCNGLTSLEIPSHITTIGKNAFSGCHGLTYMTIPKSVTNIGNGAFSNCTSLTNVIIPSNVTFIGEGAFSSCNNLNVLIENSKSNVDYSTSTFQGCKSLKWAK